MARNRKRAKERRARRPTPSRASRPGVATARPQRPDVDERADGDERSGLEDRSRVEDDSGVEDRSRVEDRSGLEDRAGLDERADRAELDDDLNSLPAPIPNEDLPSPLEHASPDVELADAQIALGRAQLDAGGEVATDEEWDEQEGEDFGGGASGDGPPADRAGSGGGASDDGPAAVPAGSGGELAPADETAPGHRRGPISRLINFLQASWRELQRVQWPDRRQVAQATGVVIGFVLIAGVFLGVADLVAGKLVNFILK